jgi:uncharacterized protein (TIGR03435 family)
VRTKIAVSKSRELLAVGIFGRASLGDRIEMLLNRGRDFSPRVSPLRVGAGSIVLLVFVVAGSLAPRWIAFAQQPDRPSFDVASIKPNIEGGGFTFAPLSGGRLTVKNNVVSNLIGNAYDVQNYQIVGGPAWLNSDRFDIQARAEGNPARPQMMRMLQTLLEDRFKLRVHRETRELPVFTLSVAKSGLKLEPWKEGSCVAVDWSNPPAPPARGQERPKYCGNNVVLPKGPNMAWSATKIDMAGLTGALSSVMRRTVIDKTGLTGTFDVQLEWTRDEAPAAPPGPAGEPATEISGTSIFTALQERLGLQLKSDKGPVEVLVIDRLEKPDAN